MAIRQYFDSLAGMALGKRAQDRERVGSRLQFFDSLGGMALGKRRQAFVFHYRLLYERSSGCHPCKSRFSMEF
ncbi:hypothetical protein TTRE_0000481501 [Trichuris trichiura]|uniref:Uncharacterized protein n=1 Tax=Trichuris trichiura TaxID=36087 RepID=A0A077ZD52_TRITR|nr:hypothetical protein TTRE_0000481501 [Trichuris trichiura]